MYGSHNGVKAFVEDRFISLVRKLPDLGDIEKELDTIDAMGDDTQQILRLLDRLFNKIDKYFFLLDKHNAFVVVDGKHGVQVQHVSAK